MTDPVHTLTALWGLRKGVEVMKTKSDPVFRMTECWGCSGMIVEASQYSPYTVGCPGCDPNIILGYERDAVANMPALDSSLDDILLYIMDINKPKYDDLDVDILEDLEDLMYPGG